jgi:hypothetical protein
MFRDVRSYECDARHYAHYCMYDSGASIISFFIPTRQYLSVVYLITDNNNINECLEMIQFRETEMTVISSHSKNERTKLAREYYWQRLAPYIIATMNLPIIDDIRRYIVSCVISIK